MTGQREGQQPPLGVVDGGEHRRHRQVEQRGRADAEMGEDAVGRVAVIGVRGEHRAQLAHPRRGLRPVAHDVAITTAAAARPRAGALQRAVGCRAGIMEVHRTVVAVFVGAGAGGLSDQSVRVAGQGLGREVRRSDPHRGIQRQPLPFGLLP